MSKWREKVEPVLPYVPWVLFLIGIVLGGIAIVQFANN